MWKKFWALPRAKQIPLATFALHFLLLLALSLHHLLIKTAPKGKIAVRTYNPPSLTVTTKPSSRATPLAAIPPPKPPPSPPKKKTPPSSKPTPTTPKKTADLKVVSSKKEEAPVSPKPPLTIPMFPQKVVREEKSLLIPNIATVEETDLSLSDPSYSERLIAILQSALDLPEFGEVKVRLSISPEGKVTSLEVLRAQSEKNRLYIEQEIPSLQFPDKKTAESFTISFKNR